MLKGLESAASNATRGVAGLNQRMADVAGGTALVRVLELAITKTKEFVVEAAKLGLEAKVQEDAFARLAKAVGVSGDALIKELDRVSGGVINTSDVMIAAARGLQEGFQPDQLIRLMEVARAQSKLAGTDVQTAFNSITQAIANQQVRALKQFGIVIDLDEATKDYARTLGVEKEQLTEVGRAQAIYQAVVRRTQASVASLSSEQLSQSEILQRYAAQWKQFREDVGKVLVDIGVDLLQFLDTIRQKLDLSEALGRLASDWKATFAGMLGPLQGQFERFSERIPELIRGIGVLSNVMQVGLAAAFSALIGPAVFLSSVLENLAKRGTPDFAKANAEAKVAVIEARAELEKTIDRLQNLIAENDKAIASTKDLGDAMKNAGERNAQSLSKLGRNAFGDIGNQVKPLVVDFDNLAKAMRALSEQGAQALMPEFEREVAQMKSGILEMIANTKGLGPAAAAALQQYADGVARVNVGYKALDETAKHVIELQRQLEESALPTEGFIGQRAKLLFELDQAIMKGVAGGLTPAQAELRRKQGADIIDKIIEGAKQRAAQAEAGELLAMMDFGAPPVDKAARVAQGRAQAFGDDIGILQAQIEKFMKDLDTALAFDFIEPGQVNIQLLIKQIQDAQNELGERGLAKRLQDLRLEFRALGDNSREALDANTLQRISAYEDRLRELGRTMRGDSEEADNLRRHIAGLKDEVEVRTVARDIFSGIGSAISTSIQGIIQGTQTLKQALDNIFQSIALGMIDKIVRKGFEEVEKAAAELVVNLVRMLGGLVSGIGTTGSASVVTGTPQGFTFPSGVEMAKGGIVTRPTLALIGEAGPEAVVPLRGIPSLASGGVVTRPTLAEVGHGGGEAVIPLGDMGGESQFIVNVYAPPGAQVEQREYQRGDSTRIRDIFISIVNQAGARGDLDSMLGGRFNLRPAPVGR